MTIESNVVFKAFRHLTTNPKLTIGLASLSLPIYFIYVARQFVEQPLGGFVFLGTEVVSILYAGWLVCQFNADSSHQAVVDKGVDGHDA